MQTAAYAEIEFDGFEQFPALRRQLVAYVEEYCAQMTLAQVGEWFEAAFLNTP